MPQVVLAERKNTKYWGAHAEKESVFKIKEKTNRINKEKKKKEKLMKKNK